MGESAFVTAGQLLVSLSGLSGVSAGAHLMAITAGAGATIYAQHMFVTTTTERLTVRQKVKREAQAPVVEAPKATGKQGSKYVFVCTSIPQHHVLTTPDEVWVMTNKETIGGN